MQQDKEAYLLECFKATQGKSSSRIRFATMVLERYPELRRNTLECNVYDLIFKKSKG